jgi:protein TonB
MTNSLKKFILFSLIIHTIFIFIFSIKWYTNIKYSTKAIDVTINYNSTSQKPDTADYLAQSVNIGGGESKTKNIPTINADESAVFPDDQHHTITPQIESKIAINDLDKELQKHDNSIVTKNNTIPTNQLGTEINDSDSAEISDFYFVVQPPSTPKLSSLIKEIDARTKLYAKQAKTRYISTKTHEYRDAEYLDAWRKKIEYYGNKYYPTQAKARNLSGNVLLLVGIKANGQINKIKIEKSSGIKILDDAAVQTIHLAAPFEQFTKEMKKDTDVLEIIRTWSFNQDGDNEIVVTLSEEEA